MGSGRILLVEDEELVARSLGKALIRSGFSVTVAPTVGGAIDALERADGAAQFHHVVLDLGLPDGDGETVLDRCDELVNRPAVIVVAAPEGVDCRRMVAFSGRCDYLPKPLIFEALLVLLRRRRNGSIDDYGREFGLSERELAVLKLAINGLDVDATANRLGCRPGTIRTYWARVLHKTDARSREQSLSHVIRWLVRTPSGATPSTQSATSGLHLFSVLTPEAAVNGASVEIESGPRHVAAK
jgi:DNA-binding response OmpR family regulator